MSSFNPLDFSYLFLNMKLLFVLLVIGVATGVQYDGLRFTFGPLENITEYFFKIPRTVTEAKAEGWRRTERGSGPMEQLTMYCQPGEEYHVCLLFTPCESIAGIQLGFPADKLTVAAIDRNKWFTKWRTPANCDGQPGREYLTITQYLVSEEFLASEDCEAANGSTLRDNGVWVHDHSGELMRIPLTEAEIRSKTPFTKQNCTPRMGTHYHYNMTREMLCENQLPWFALVINGELIGSGLQLFGELTETPKPRNWFEKLGGRQLVRAATPFGPPCVYNLADVYPLLSFHIYYIDNPDSIQCRDEDSADPSTIL